MTESKAMVLAGKAPAGLVPTSIDEAWRLAQCLAAAGEMVPEDYRGYPNKVMAAIIKGLEVGMYPMQALAYIAVIRGRPCLWGDAINALVQRAGHHLDYRLDGTGEARTATATLTRADGRQITRSFSVEDAKTAGLWGKRSSAGKPTPWIEYPDRMLAMRARAWAARDGAADALMGLAIREERESSRAEPDPMEVLGPPIEIKPEAPVIHVEMAGSNGGGDDSYAPAKAAPGLLFPDGELRGATKGGLTAWMEAWRQTAKFGGCDEDDPTFATALDHARALYVAGKAAQDITAFEIEIGEILEMRSS